MRAYWSSRRGKARGSVAVEMALVAPFLLLLVLGCVEWGFFFFVENVVVNSAREAARAGSIAPDAGSIEARAREAMSATLRAGGLDPARAEATVDPSSGNSVKVTLTYPAGSVTGARFIPLPDRAWARAEMRR
jgi:Flp pilus assembly protein TadG